MRTVLERLTEKRILAQQARKQSPAFIELQRVVDLPIETPPTPEEIEAFCAEFMLAEAYDRGDRLWPQQVAAILGWALNPGMFGAITVGGGKSAIAYSIASIATTDHGHEHIVALVPPQVARDFAERHLKFARRMIPIPFEVWNLHGLDRSKRRKMFAARRPGLYVLPYSLLSTQDGEELLNTIGPTLIIADEAHSLRHASAARTQRVRRYLDAERPSFVAMSGTVTNKSLKDYWHLTIAALQNGAPLPKSSHVLRAWMLTLDADVKAEEVAHEFDLHSSSLDYIMPLLGWARRNFPDESFADSQAGFRRAYQKRLTTTPGVVKLTDNEATLGTSLVLDDRPAPAAGSEGWDRLTELTEQVTGEWIAPNGDEIEHAMHTWRWLWELSAGFYNDLYWPTPEELAEKEHIDVGKAQTLLDRAKVHHEARQEYHRLLRKWLQSNARPQLDTPLLVAKSMADHGSRYVGAELHQVWSEMHDLDFEGRPDRWKRPIRVCDYKVREAERWADENGRGVIWTMSPEIAKWVAEEVDGAILCPAGKAGNDRILKAGDREHGGDGSRLVVASIQAHGTGKNLQAFEHQMFVQWPRSAQLCEQVLGRLHRPGQQADELVARLCSSTDTDHLTLAASLNDAAYIDGTTGVRQKLMSSSYVSPPSVFDPAELRRLGLSPKNLTGEQLQRLRDIAA